LQERFPIPGPAFLRLNRLIVTEVTQKRPDLVLFWRPTHISPKTISYISELGIKTASYNNDDPFVSNKNKSLRWDHHFLWYWYTQCLKYFHHNFFFRKINCDESKKFGAKNVHLLMPYFLPWQDHPDELSKDEKVFYKAEVVFVGHFENDGRDDSINTLLDAGINVKVWGGHYWNQYAKGSLRKHLPKIVPAEGLVYRKVLSGSTICLCFLSKINRDLYTRRCFEIPACGKLLLAERTMELQKLFKEDIEACFFSNNDELLQKVRWLLDNPLTINQIAKAGRERVIKDGHDVFGRAKYFLEALEP
jgi:hypothetical protein